jgi:hypothetical protein
MSGTDYNVGYRFDITWLPIAICDDHALSLVEAVQLGEQAVRPSCHQNGNRVQLLQGGTWPNGS